MKVHAVAVVYHCVCLWPRNVCEDRAKVSIKKIWDVPKIEGHVRKILSYVDMHYASDHHFNENITYNIITSECAQYSYRRHLEKSGICKMPDRSDIMQNSWSFR